MKALVRAANACPDCQFAVVGQAYPCRICKSTEYCASCARGPVWAAQCRACQRWQWACYVALQRGEPLPDPPSAGPAFDVVDAALRVARSQHQQESQP